MSVSRTYGDAQPRASVRGVVFIHSCPRALAPHIEWTLANILGPGARLAWIDQPIQTGSLRSELAWQSTPGTASAIASQLQAFPGVRFEVTQEPTVSTEGERYASTPRLGIFRAAMNHHGDIVVNEEQLRAALLESQSGADLPTLINNLMGAQWDEELEPFRYAGDGAPVRWVHAVG